MTTSEAAQQLGISRRAVLFYIKDKRLEATLRGRDWGITMAALLKLKRRGYTKKGTTDA